MNLTARVAVVTGASRGIGAGIAHRFAEAGARVVVHYRGDEQGAADVVAAIRSGGGEACALHADLSEPAAVNAFFEQVGRKLGALDVLVNNAGAYPGGPLRAMTVDDWRDVFRANVDTTFFCLQAAAKRMPQGSAIVNIASIDALSPGAGHGHYNSAKAAVVMLTRSAAQELGRDGIRVNAVSPGLIARPDIDTQWPDGVRRWCARAPLARLGAPEDVADACLFLATPASRWITGHNLVVDGGMLSATSY